MQNNGKPIIILKMNVKAKPKSSKQMMIAKMNAHAIINKNMLVYSFHYLPKWL